MNLLVTDMYLDAFRQLKRGNHKGVVSNAKPYLVLSILDAIEAKSVLNNRIYFEVLSPYYKKENAQFSPEIKPSSMSYPFYHLWTETFYHLQWKTTPQKKEAPSAKFVKDNIEYAYLDNALWDLLQDKETRDLFRQTIENYYLK